MTAGPRQACPRGVPADAAAATATTEALETLVRRLRGYAKVIRNPAAARTMGRDMLAAAQALEQRLPGPGIDPALLAAALPAAEAMALARMAKRFLYEDAERFANRRDGGAERDALLAGVTRLRSILAAAGPARR